MVAAPYLLAGALAFVLWLGNVVGVIPGHSWMDLSWSWVIAGLVVAGWWAIPNPVVGLAILGYVLLTVVRTYRMIREPNATS